MKAFVTGATGFIGSHTCVELMANGWEVIGVDNFSNSFRSIADRIAQISAKPFSVIELDIRDTARLEKVLSKHKPDLVVHFAAFKCVGEAVENPLLYYDNNVGGMVSLCRAMNSVGVKRMVFSSSATVYGDAPPPLSESAAMSPTNPYGQTKVICEQILRDLIIGDNNWSTVILRYFNPCGAHSSALIGEIPRGVPNNLLPYVAQVAAGEREQVLVFGNDYPTADGTGIRDYIHVVDLAAGHVAAVNWLAKNKGELTVNLGTGKGYSVMEVINSFKAASGKPIPFKVIERRKGDVAASFADPTLAKSALSWSATLDLDDMCRDLWRWQESLAKIPIQ